MWATAACANARRSASRSTRAIVLSASAGKVSRSRTRWRVKVRLTAPMKTILLIKDLLLFTGDRRHIAVAVLAHLAGDHPHLPWEYVPRLVVTRKTEHGRQRAGQGGRSCPCARQALTCDRRAGE